MKIGKISKTEEKVVFLVKGIRNSIANAIRRSTEEIYTLAIDSVEFYKNDSALYDEILAHRLGLVPLRVPKTLRPREKCDCKGKGCLKCTVMFKLKAKGPCTVYASDLKAKGAEVVFGEMPLVILAKDQELQLTAEAILGKGKEHTKFVPGLLWFNSYPIISTKNCEACGECIAVCPKKAIAIKGKEIVIDPLKCDLCEACVEFIKSKSKKCFIKIEPSTEDFIFFIESFGHLAPEEIFTEAIETIDENLNILAKAIKK
ncbi:MAG: DNA-directed RNA polymerase subunit D [Candidatus Pacearchaeota archaeon]|nr:DNA-directed RNA polymerase subunit D [Candidatus Pacearchaeota archaeon]